MTNDKYLMQVNRLLVRDVMPLTENGSSKRNKNKASSMLHLDEWAFFFFLYICLPDGRVIYRPNENKKVNETNESWIIFFLNWLAYGKRYGPSYRLSATATERTYLFKWTKSLQFSSLSFTLNIMIVCWTFISSLTIFMCAFILPTLLLTYTNLEI